MECCFELLFGETEFLKLMLKIVQVCTTKSLRDKDHAGDQGMDIWTEEFKKNDTDETTERGKRSSENVCLPTMLNYTFQLQSC